MSCKVAFIGLGVMGYPMAGYISKAGHDVTVYNRTKAKAENGFKNIRVKLQILPWMQLKTVILFSHVLATTMI